VPDIKSVASFLLIAHSFLLVPISIGVVIKVKPQKFSVPELEKFLSNFSLVIYLEQRFINYT